MSGRPDDTHRADLDFTARAEDFLGTLLPDSPEEEEDLYFDSAESIYTYLVNRLEEHGFGDYLKRYIYEETGMEGDYRAIPNDVYQEIIIESFRDNAADFSFYPTKAHKKDVVRTWLERKVVSRDTVLLLGFGLNMTLDSVNGLLHKALHEPHIDPKEPLEAVCQYCFQNGFAFPRFKKIWERFDPDHPECMISGDRMDSTAQCRETLAAIRDDDALLAYLFRLPLQKGSKRQSLSARKAFDSLYAGVREGLARRKTETESGEALLLAQRRANELARSDRQYWHQNWEESERILRGARVYTGKEIGDADIENELFMFVPKNAQGNLAPMKNSTLNELFNGKRLNRQHIGRIEAGDDPVTRYDLITMSFFRYDLERDSQANEIGLHYDGFVRATNRMLEECNMDRLYAANPYESFIMLCMRTESPIETYAEIWGMSYDEY